MGAMTYIGNGPNFMVKAIAEKSGVKMPSFFGYMVYSCLILLPLFALDLFCAPWPSDSVLSSRDPRVAGRLVESRPTGDELGGGRLLLAGKSA